MKARGIRSAQALLLALLSGLLVLPTGCASEETETCEGVTCSDHGTCAMVGGKATCQCDEGYKMGDNRVTCVADSGGSGLDGQPCDDSGDCVGGTCLKYSDETTGYCTSRDCATHADCKNNGTDKATTEMCCLKFGGGDSICIKIQAGYTCGDQTGTCGNTCAGQRDTACDPAYACLSTGLEDPNAFCSKECVTDADCAACSDTGDPDKEFTCQNLADGSLYCLEKPGDNLCESGADCDEGEVCTAVPNEEETEMVGMCGNFGGSKMPGEECDEDAAEPECSGFYCMGGHCSEVCSMETDCPEGMVCYAIPFCMDAQCTVTAPPIGMCYWMDGSLTPCGGDPDCPTGEICDVYFDPTNGVEKVCTTWECDPSQDGCAGAGDECGEGKDPCYNGLCLSTQWCSAWCDDHEDCPDDMICAIRIGLTETDWSAGCVKFNGSASPCTNEADCDTSGEGATDETCTYIPNVAGGMDSVCMTPNDPSLAFGDECGGDIETPCPNDLCIGSGEDYHCVTVCMTSDDCGEGHFCGGFRYDADDPTIYGACLEAPGSGVACESDGDCTGHVPAEACMYNLTPSQELEALCLEQIDGGAGFGADCGGEVYCYNDLCIGSNNDYHCSRACTEHADCPKESGYLCGSLHFTDDLIAGACMGGFEGNSLDPCEGNADCTTENETCIYFPPPNKPMEGICVEQVCDPADANCSDVGGTCNETTHCLNDFCLTSNYCSAACASDADCSVYQVDSKPMVCSFIGFSETELGTACIGPDGTGVTGDACNETDKCANGICIGKDPDYYCSIPCKANLDCPDSPAMECHWVNLGSNDAPILVSACVKTGTDSPLCSLCEDIADCDTGICFENADTHEKFCTKPCTDTIGSTDCPDGSTCLDLGADGTQCVPADETCK